MIYVSERSNSIWMNVFVEQLSQGSLEELEDDRLVIEDNVGESIHIHMRNLRLEMSVDDFIELADGFEEGLRRLEDGDS